MNAGWIGEASKRCEIAGRGIVENVDQVENTIHQEAEFQKIERHAGDVISATLFAVWVSER